MQNKIAAIPKSVHKERIEENFIGNDFMLSKEDMNKISKLDEGKSLILDVRSIDEVYRLHNIRFNQ